MRLIQVLLYRKYIAVEGGGGCAFVGCYILYNGMRITSSTRTYY